jgi:hypothetical protein
MRAVLIAALSAACLLGRPVWAAGGEKSAAPPESTQIVGRGLDAPTAVMARSLLFPGWGQAKNGMWVKAVAVAAIEGSLLERVLFEDRIARRYGSLAERLPVDDPARVPYDQGLARHRAHRRDFIWWTSLFVLLSMGDAYTDAHLKRFDVRLQDSPPAEGSRGGGSGGVRLEISLRN